MLLHRLNGGVVAFVVINARGKQLVYFKVVRIAQAGKVGKAQRIID